jgi:hypothetical protein
MTSRIARLEEQRRAPARCHIIRMSDPPTADELAELAQAEAEGGPRIILHPRPSRNGLSAILTRSAGGGSQPFAGLTDVRTISPIPRS